MDARFWAMFWPLVSSIEHGLNTFINKDLNEASKILKRKCDFQKANVLFKKQVCFSIPLWRGQPLDCKYLLKNGFCNQKASVLSKKQMCFLVSLQRGQCPYHRYLIGIGICEDLNLISKD